MENKVLNKLNTLGGKEPSGASPSLSEEKEYTSTKAEMEIANLQEELDGKQQDRVGVYLPARGVGRHILCWLWADDLERHRT